MKAFPLVIVARAQFEGGKFLVSGQIDQWVILDRSLPITIQGYCIAGALVATPKEGPVHTLLIQLVGPDTAPILLPLIFEGGHVELEPQKDGAFSGAFFIPLDGIKLPGLGGYQFKLIVDGEEIAASLLNVVHWPHRARLILKHLLQDLQGVTPDEHYLTGRIVADVIADGRTREDLIISVKQSSGSQSLSDPLEIRLPDGYADLQSAPEARPAIEAFYRSRTIGTPDAGSGATVIASNNLISGPPVIVDLTLASESGAAW